MAFPGCFLLALSNFEFLLIFTAVAVHNSKLPITNDSSTLPYYQKQNSSLVDMCTKGATM